MLERKFVRIARVAKAGVTVQKQVTIPTKMVVEMGWVNLTDVELIRNGDEITIRPSRFANEERDNG